MEKIKFNNGLQLALMPISGIRSVSIGIFTGAGCIFENEKTTGISHLIEHMVFKGTENRSAFKIVEEIDEMGAQINAYTAKEITCFYTKSVDEQAEKCFEILSDIFFNATFDENELKKEKNVVLEEISMVEDTPDDIIFDMLASVAFKGHPLQKPILGTSESVKSFTPADMRDYMKKYYIPSNTVIAVAGNMNLDTAAKFTEKYFVNNFVSGGLKPKAPARHSGSSGNIIKVKDIEQANICLSFPCFPYDHELYYAQAAFNYIFGNGMTSRLFQKLREEQGLCYSVYSYPSVYINNGILTIYTGTNLNNVEKSVLSIKEEIKSITEKGFTEKEFLRGKEQLKGGFILGQENSSALMMSIGRYLLLTGKNFDLNEKLDAINKVTYDQAVNVMHNIFNFEKVSAAYVGKNPSCDIYEIIKN